MANSIKLSSYTTAVIIITTIPKGMKVKFSEKISENFCFMDANLPSVCRISKGYISNILGTVSCVKLKLTTLVVGDVGLTKRQCLHHTSIFTSIFASLLLTLLFLLLLLLLLLKLRLLLLTPPPTATAITTGATTTTTTTTTNKPIP